MLSDMLKRLRNAINALRRDKQIFEVFEAATLFMNKPEAWTNGSL